MSLGLRSENVRINGKAFWVLDYGGDKKGKEPGKGTRSFVAALGV